MVRKRRLTQPGKILDELYIKPLKLNLHKLANRLCVAQNTLFKIRTYSAAISPAIALSLAEAFDTTPQLWLNLQINYDLWMEEHVHTQVKPILKNGELFFNKQNLEIVKAPFPLKQRRPFAFSNSDHG